MSSVENHKTKKSPMRRLNDDETVLLISFVQSRECLWNETNEDFKRINITRKLWNEIGTQLNISGEEARNKWKNLKDKFRKLLRQSQEDPNAETGTCSSTSLSQWKFHNAMLFLRDVLQPTDQTTVVNCVANNNTMAGGSGGDHEIVDGDFQEYDVDFLVKKTPDRECLVSIPRSIRNRGGPSLLIGGGAKRKNDNNDGEFLQQRPEEFKFAAAAAAATSTAQEDKRNEDDYYFLMSLLPYIQSLNSIEKLELRSKMQNLVTESYKKHDLNKRCRVNH